MNCNVFQNSDEPEIGSMTIALLTLADDTAATGVTFRNEPLRFIHGYKLDSRNDSGLTGWTITHRHNGRFVDSKTIDGSLRTSAG